MEYLVAYSATSGYHTLQCYPKHKGHQHLYKHQIFVTSQVQFSGHVNSSEHSVVTLLCPVNTLLYKVFIKTLVTWAAFNILAIKIQSPYTILIYPEIWFGFRNDFFSSNLILTILPPICFGNCIQEISNQSQSLEHRQTFEEISYQNRLYNFQESSTSSVCWDQWETPQL